LALTGARIPDWPTLDAALRRKISSTAVERARRLEPRLNAFVALEEGLLPVEGHLGGLPYAVKDMFRTASHQPTGGLANPSDLAIEGQTDLLKRLDDSGARRVGFTGLPELAYEPSGYNHARGRVRNPWNLDFIVGGSSSGSAAAVASGSAMVALGSDTAGSLRIPAHCCGITAWKPTYGLFASTGAMPLAPTLDSIGLLARSVRDMQTTANLLITDDAPSTSRTIAHARVITDCFTVAEQAIRQACHEGLDCIEASGTRLESCAALAKIEAVDAHALIVLQAEAARIHRARTEDGKIPPMLRKRLTKGLAIDEAALAASIAMRETLSHDFAAQVFGAADAIILPVMAIRVPRALETDPAADEFSPATLYALSRFTRFVNMLGFPAIAVPVGFDDRGLPVALQIVGRPRTDLALLALGQAIQHRSHWHAQIPDAVADAITDLAEL
jgi:aspartyl-tRNA(Asn)/glutamyl-tRNA(Gln) amidotransferase subunit A